MNNTNTDNALNEAALSGIVAGCSLKETAGTAPTACVLLYSKTSPDSPGDYHKVKIPLMRKDLLDIFEKMPEKCHRINERIKNGETVNPSELTRINATGRLVPTGDGSVVLAAQQVREAGTEEMPVNRARLTGTVEKTFANRNFAGIVLDSSESGISMNITVSAKTNPREFTLAEKLREGDRITVDGTLKSIEFSDGKTREYTIEASSIRRLYIRRINSQQVNH